MAWYLPWKRMTLSGTAPAEEVQRRLALSTAEWNLNGWGTPIPSPPWEGNAFRAIRGAVFLSPVPIVMTGTIRPEGQGVLLEVVMRPHGFLFVPLAMYVVGVALMLPGAGPLGQVFLPFSALGAYMMLVGLSRERFPAIQRVLEDAIRPPGSMATPGQGGAWP